MDSLLANYASSDEEEEDQQEQVSSLLSNPSSGNTKPSLLSSLPLPKSFSLFQSLPPPNLPSKSHSSVDADTVSHKPKDPKSASKFRKNTSFFSSLPQPKPLTREETLANLLSFDPNSKSGAQSKPRIYPSLSSTATDDDEEEDDEEKKKEEEERKRRKISTQSFSHVKSFLSSLPAARTTATLGVQTISGSGRRSVIETETSTDMLAPASNLGGYGVEENNVGVDQNAGNNVSYGDYVNYQSGVDPKAGNFVNYDYNGNLQPGINQNIGTDMGHGNFSNYVSNANFQLGVSQNVGTEMESGNYSNYGSYGNYGSYEGYNAYVDYEQYNNNWGDGSRMSGPADSVMNENGVRHSSKRGKSDIPAEIIEVKQDELMKNRPREDQMRLTGIAFGASYQPASTKGKPSKLHKRKHQIGSLFFDMKQKEMELAERRAKGFLTKSETQAKYGW